MISATLSWFGDAVLAKVKALAEAVVKKAVGEKKKRSRYGVFQRTAGVLDGSWIPILSSWVDAARYDRTEGILYIRTKGLHGKEYPWTLCEPEKAQAFFRAQSAGKFLWRWFPPRQSRAAAKHQRRQRGRQRQVKR